MSKSEKKTKLTARQLKAIPHIVSSPTYTEGVPFQRQVGQLGLVRG